MLTINSTVIPDGDADLGDNLLYYDYNIGHLLSLQAQGQTLEDETFVSAFRSFEGEVYENYIYQYKALLLQCEQEFEIMINVRLYQEIIVPLFQIKHGQFAAVALCRGGATKSLKKVWEAFIVRRDRLVLKEQQKSLQTKQRFENQLKAAQQSAGAQIDARCDANLANVDDRVKRIIQETVKSQSIKKDALAINISTLSNMDNTLATTGNFNTINLIPRSVKRN